MTTKAIIHLRRLVLAVVLLLTLSGCLQGPTVYVENTTWVMELESALNASNAALVVAQDGLSNATVALTVGQTALQACDSSLYACLAKPPEPQNCTVQNCTPCLNCTTNLTKYSFTCADEYPGYYFETKYRCFWDVRQRYQTGKYTNMAEMCQALGLPDACACYWSMTEYTGIRASTGAYPGG